jgi:hypothetical protein
MADVQAAFVMLTSADARFRLYVILPSLHTNRR